MTEVKLTSIQKTLMYSNKKYDILTHINQTIFKVSAIFILAVRFFFLFQLNAHIILNTYIYRQLPATCFGVCYTMLMETTALIDQKKLHEPHSCSANNAMSSLKVV